MHFEVLKVRLHSLKDFAKHYLMIVLSILTALGLEAWIEHAHHTHAAEAASQQIEAEIRANLAETDAALRQEVVQLGRLEKIRDAVTRDLRANEPDDVIGQHILDLTKDNFDLNLHFPTLRHEAWDVAVANQSASWIEHDSMQRYSVAYARQRDILTSMNADIALLMNGTGMVDTIADLRTGSVQPRAFLHVVSQMTAMTGQTVNQLRRLEKQLREAVPGGDQGTAQATPAG